MGRQTLDRIKKTTCILLAVLFVVSLTASAAGATCSTKTSTTGLGTSISGLPGLSGINLNKLVTTYGFNTVNSDLGFNIGSLDSDLDSNLASFGITL
jgi:hypothetical protein